MRFLYFNAMITTCIALILCLPNEGWRNPFLLDLDLECWDSRSLGPWSWERWTSLIDKCATFFTSVYFLEQNGKLYFTFNNVWDCGGPRLQSRLDCSHSQLGNLVLYKKNNSSSLLQLIIMFVSSKSMTMMEVHKLRKTQVFIDSNSSFKAKRKMVNN